MSVTTTITALQTTGLVLLSLYLLWVLYLAVMNILRVKKLGKLTKVTTLLSMPVVVSAFLLDVAINFVVFTLLLLELPKELTVSSRLKRHNNTSTGYRKKLAKLFEPLLDPFDPDGDHI